ncbi:MAG: sugar transferase [Eubacterium sp.]|nr:sugar transferase [Eubacterium sp.]
MEKKGKVQFRLEYLADLACLIIANIISYVAFHYVYVKIADYPANVWYQYIFVLVVTYTVVFTGFYSRIDITQRNRSHETVSLIRNATLTYFMLLTVLVLLKSRVLESRYMLLAGYLIYIVLLFPERYFLKRWITGFFTHSKTASIAGVITTSDIAEEFISGILNDWTLKVTGVVLVDEVIGHRRSEMEDEINGSAAVLTQKKEYPKSFCDIPVISSGADYMEWIRSAPLDEVFININEQDTEFIQEIVEELEDMGITVHLNIPRLSKMLDESKFNNINCRVYAGYPMATFAATQHSTAQLAIKRIADIVLGLIGSILSLPIIAIVAIPLKKESPGPIIFKQTRIGRNGRPFNIYKIRSMYVDAEERKAEYLKQNEMDGFMFKMENDPRITNVGKVIRKYSIDELPQFFNVLKGDMSLVGTRPPTVDEFRKYESRHKRRLSMRPGITGMWQVNGRSEITDFEEVVKLDFRYIDEWSIRLDIQILLKTVIVVLTHRGAR